MTGLVRVLRGAAVGLWDFLVGDTPVMLPAVLAVVGLAYLLRDLRPVAVVVLPAVVVGVLAASAAGGRRRGR